MSEHDSFVNPSNQDSADAQHPEAISRPSDLAMDEQATCEQSTLPRADSSDSSEFAAIEPVSELTSESEQQAVEKNDSHAFSESDSEIGKEVAGELFREVPHDEALTANARDQRDRDIERSNRQPFLFVEQSPEQSPEQPPEQSSEQLTAHFTQEASGQSAECSDAEATAAAADEQSVDGAFDESEQESEADIAIEQNVVAQNNSATQNVVSQKVGEQIIEAVTEHTAKAIDASADDETPDQRVADEANPSDAESSSRKARPKASKQGVSGDEPTQNSEIVFSDLALSQEVLQAVEISGYQNPTPIQSQIIPHLLDGRDVLAQSQTGTGKTAAFALPVLSRIKFDRQLPQVLVLAPTRELAIQVSESFSTYAACMKRLNVATIYGGQSYDPQLRQLRSGAQIVVGTPGRVMDHMRRGTLDLSGIECLVLDEADEMLSMGFLEDVMLILEHTPADRQIALFSATVPEAIEQIAQQHLSDPVHITVKKKTMTADSIRHRALIMSPRDKIYALGRMIEAEQTDGIIVFTKTKAATLTVAETLSRQGRSAVALNGDMPQAARERTIDQFKSGRLDILVATDVAARGLDVSRVSHVFNFDLPHDVESYIHRVGRTGRAGRAGEAIIFLSRSQRGRLRTIERVTNQRIEIVDLPTTDDMNQLRIKRFEDSITEVISQHDLTLFKKLIDRYSTETGKPLEMIAAALAHLNQQGRPFLEKDRPKAKRNERSDWSDDGDRPKGRSRRGDDGYGTGESGFRDSGSRDSGGARARRPRRNGPPEAGMQRYRIEVGRRDGVKPGNIVGAVANEAGIEGEFIGPITINDSYSTVDLPEGMPSDIYQSLRRTRVVGKPLQIRLQDGSRHEESDEGGTKSRQERRREFAKGDREGKRQGKEGGRSKPSQFSSSTTGNKSSSGKKSFNGKKSTKGKRPSGGAKPPKGKKNSQGKRPDKKKKHQHPTA